MSQDHRNDTDIAPDWSDLGTEWLEGGEPPVRERIVSSTGSWTPAERRATSRVERARIERELAEKARAERERARKIREEAERERLKEAELERILAEGAREKEEAERAAEVKKAAEARRREAELAAASAPERTARTAAITPERTHTAQTESRHAAPAADGRQTAHAAAQANDWERMRAAEKGHSSSGKKRGGIRSLGAPIIVLIAVLVIGVIVAGWQLIRIFSGYQRDRSAYNDLASMAISGLAEQDEKTAGGEAGADGTEGENAATEVPISVDWDFLRSVNPDVVGWIYCPDTIINYPVVQTDNHDFYLDHGFDGKPNGAGTIFADMDSVVGVMLSNYIIYGHNMKDNSMFGTFQGYVNENYYKDHPVMYFLTPDRSYRVELVCAHVVDSFETNFPTYFSNEAEYQAYIDAITSSAFWINEDAVTTEYQMLTMSTCTYGTQYDDARMLLHGILVPIQ